MKKGQRLPPKQRIKIELELPKGFLDQLSPLPTSRVAGAAITAAGIYTIVRLVDQFGRGLVEGIKKIHQDIFTDVSVPVINVFTSIFGIQVKKKPEEAALEMGLQPQFLTTLQELGQFDPFAFGAALMGGGMVLAGLNPGEVLKGIGSIIDALIPL